MGEDGLSHGMTPAHLKRIQELERKIKSSRKLVAEESDWRGKLKDELLKEMEMSLGEKKQTVMQYNSQGLQLERLYP